MLNIIRHGLTAYFLYLAYMAYTSPYAVNLAEGEVLMLAAKCVAAALLCRVGLDIEY